MRQKLIYPGLIFIFLLLFLGLFNLQVIQNHAFRQLSNKNCVRLLPQEGSRGKILDRQGNVIVGNFLSYDVMILPREAGRLDEVLRKAAQILGADFKNLQEAFKSNFTAPSLPVAIAKNIDVKKAIALEELKADLDGLLIQQRPQRAYPYGRLASHAIGYLSEIDRWRLTKLQDYGYRQKDIVGFGGIEEKYDYYLRQEEGGLSIEVDHRGRQVRVLGFKPPRNGRDIQLTLDLRIQKIVEANLADRKGCVIVMNPHSGEIIALASSPNFSPAAFIKQDNSAMRGFLNDPDAPLMDRAISGVFPAGSVFKLVVAAAALELEKINLSSAFLCQGGTHIGKQEFACWNTHGQQGLIEAITNSCNVFFYRTGLLLGPEAIHDYAFKLGFSKLTLVDLPYEASGLVPSPLWKRVSRLQNWFDGDTANFAIGQGDLLVTPIQLARMMAVFANKGNLVTPYIVKSIDGQDISRLNKKIVILPLREDTLKIIRRGLRRVVSAPHGTANILSDLPVPIAGKTGTVQVKRRGNHGWFAGFFPFENPQYLICTLLEYGGSGQAACVLTKQIIKDMVNEGLI